MDILLHHRSSSPKRELGRRALDQALQSITQGVVVAGPDENILSVNTAFTVITGFSEAECIGRNCRFLQGPATDIHTIEKIHQACTNATPFSGEILNYRKDGTVFWNDLLISSLKDAEGKTTHFIGITRDVTARKEVDQALIRTRYRLDLAVKAGGIGIWDWDVVNDHLIWDRGMYALYGIDEQDFLGAYDAWQKAVHPEDRDQADRDIRDALQSGEFKTEFRVLWPDGSIHYIRGNALVVKDSAGIAIRMVGTNWDITEQKLSDLKIQELAFYDPLTQVLNRRLFEDRLHQKLLRTQRSQHYGALLFADLDHFKELNDHYGHQMGDLRLIDVAKRIKECVRQVDTVARYGGDEFVIILDELGSDQATAHLQAKKIAEKLCQSLSASSCLNELERKLCSSNEPGKCRCSVSIGVKLFKGGEITQEQLIAQADAAMYRAKKAGGSRVQFYEEVVHE